MRSPIPRAMLLSAGLFLSGTPLAARATQGSQSMGGMNMPMGQMDAMSACPMMTAEMRGPGAALNARTALHLSAAQVGQLETIKGQLDKGHKTAMDSMDALHRQINALAAAPQLDQRAARAAFDRMGQLHGGMGFEMFVAQHDVAGILTAAQNDSLAAMGKAKMSSGKMMTMGGGIC